MLLANLMLLLAPMTASTDSLAVFDIGKASAAEVRAMKATETGDWWLELGDRMVLVGAPAHLQSRMQQQSPIATRIGIDPSRLVLRARGCREDHAEAGSLIIRGGRWELRLLADGEAMPQARDEHGGWMAVEHNSVVARQYRLDANSVTAADPSVLPLVAAVDSARWFADVQTLAGWDRSSYGTTSLNAARDWIGAQFAALGLQVTTPTFTMSGAGGSGPITRNNVVGFWTGSDLPDEWIVVGAHYDSRTTSLSTVIGTPGADDNASGCAGVIEMARVLLPYQPRRSVMFMCYAGEEQGLLGSAAHVQSLNLAGNLAKLKAVVIMDMIGYSADANLQALFESKIAHTAYLQQFGDAAHTYVPELDVLTSTNPFGSDHMPYLNAGVKTLLAIEADYDLYPFYHRSTDTPTNIGVNAQPMGAAILKTNIAVLADLAGAHAEVETFADGFEDTEVLRSNQR